MKHLSIGFSILCSLFLTTVSAQLFQDMGKYNSQGVPAYLDKTKEDISPTLLADLNILLPDGENLPKKNPKLYSSNTMTAIKLKQSGDVYLAFVSEGADFKSAVGFYTFKGTPPSQKYMINNLKVVFPNVSGSNSGGGLQQGHRVKLGNFPAGTSIGFFLISNGFQYGRVMQAGNDVFYTDPQYNPETNKDLRKHAVLLFDEVSSRYVLMFEDFNRSGGDHDFNDAVFIISTPTANTLSTEGATQVQKEKEIKLGIPEKKITICHHPDGIKDKTETITIAESAWPAHQAHGDALGDCPVIIVEKPVTVQQTEEVKRITICHYPPGNPGNPQELSIPESAWAVHEAHGDVQGKCDGSGQATEVIEVRRITICHYPPGSPNNPQEITIPETAWAVHEAHGDVKGNCGGGTVIKTEEKKITICHYPPGSPNNPQEITIPESAWAVHEAHGDVQGKCSGNVPAPDVKPEERRFAICHFPPGDPNHPQEITIPASAWSVHEAHGDMIGKCNGARPVEAPPEEIKITICHYPPGSPNNPQEIVIPESAWTAHEAHGDTKGNCTESKPVIQTPVEEKKITICHYPPGNPNNPQEITISESAWAAHEAHGDTRGKCGGSQPVIQTPQEEKEITICHYPPGNRSNPQQLSIPESAWAAHQAHGDIQGNCTETQPATTPVEEKQITICHYPPGNPNNPQEISIPESAWAAHEAHGDTQGKCKEGSPATETKPEEKKITICHYPPGKKSNPQEISIPESAWKAHEAHGDSKGKCKGK